MDIMNEKSEIIDRIIDNVEDIKESHVGSSRFTDISIDVKRVQRAISDAGENAFGIMAIDLWTLDEKDGKLHHYGHSGMNWISKVYRNQLSDDTNQSEILETLDRLVNTTRDDFLEPLPQPIGVGLAGILWSQQVNLANYSNPSQALKWHEVREFSMDPDQMPYERMIYIEKVFGKVTGIPFEMFGLKGVVLYFARKAANSDSLNTPVNATFLRVAAQNIASSAAMTIPRLQSVDARKELIAKILRRTKAKISVMRVFKNIARDSQRNLDIEAQEEVHEKTRLKSTQGRDMLKISFVKAVTYSKYIVTKAKSTLKKSTNPPGLHPPPGAPLKVAQVSFVGSFITLMILGYLNWIIKNATNDEYGMVLGPFGALITLQYALTAAPAAQPRNSIFGFLLSGSITIILKELCLNIVGFPRWIVPAIATSMSILTMQLTGVVHPPAGACSLVFSLSKHDFKTDWIDLLLVMVADIICIAVAVAVNNANDNRQYPMYWNLNILEYKKSKLKTNNDPLISKPRRQSIARRTSWFASISEGHRNESQNTSFSLFRKSAGHWRKSILSMGKPRGKISESSAHGPSSDDVQA